jgi:hypothetical protein
MRDIACFQERLMRLLRDGLPPEEIRAALLADKELAGFRDYINAMEPRMLEVANELIVKWGVAEE